MESNIYFFDTPKEATLNTQQTQFLDSLSPEVKSIILAVNTENFSLYLQSSTFLQIMQEISQNTQPTLESLKNIQYYILKHTQPQDFKAIKPALLRLHTAELLSENQTRKLLHLFTQITLHAKEEKQKEVKHIDLKTLGEELHVLYKKLHELKLDREIDAKLQKIQENVKNHKFSLGITGVLSAGKSTFLNALLGKEILGSATIPETANLTILKQSAREYAKVYFWNLAEWQELKAAAQYDKSLQEFVYESEKIFGENLHHFITEKTKSQEIALHELPKFTSANHESKLCNLVKEVELYVDLKFLQNNTEIVDTPGLDDPITKREEITKSYIANCDLLIHVMNASCVATQIDIDFILESLVTQNISRLLVVLTRIDLIGEKELAQSLEYTKQSLAMQLRKVQYNGDIEALIQRIDFIPTASFLALLHRTNRSKEALNKGFSLEKTGILEVEKYLDTMLLGENSLKQKDILYIAYRGFLKITQTLQEEVFLESKLLNASAQELESFIKNLKNENTELLKSLQNHQRIMQEKQDELKDFLDSLQNFVTKNLKTQQEKLKNRIFDEITYGYVHNNAPTQTRINEILESGFNDCFSDVNRDYKYKIAKKITQMLLDANENPKQPQMNFHAPKESLMQSIALLQDSLPKLIASHSKRTQNNLLLQLDKIFQESFRIFSSAIESKNKEIQEKFLDYFTLIMQLEQNTIKAQIAKKEAILQKTLREREKVDSKARKDAIQKKQKELENIANELEYIANALK